jgi:hypothetical protein
LNDPENKRRIAEFEKMALDDQAKRAVVVAASAKLFDPKSITRKAKGIHEVYDADLGTIRYTYLTYDDLMEIGEMRDPITKQPLGTKERSIQILLKQLATTYPSLSVDELKAWPFEVVTKLLVKLQGEGSFFHRKPQVPPQASKAGSTPT